METKMKPQATDKVIVERNNDRFVTVHSAEHDVLDFIRAQPFWQYPHHVAKHANAPTHIYGRISPLYELETTITWLEGLTVADIPDDFEYPDVEDYSATFEDDDDDTGVHTYIGVVIDPTLFDDDEAQETTDVSK